MNTVRRSESGGPAPPVSKLADEELLQLVVNGNWSAFDQFVHRYERRLIAYLSQRISPRPNIQTIEDLAQETFLRAFRAAKSGRTCDGLASVATWLFAIANNIVRDHFRSEQRKPMTLDCELPQGSPDLTLASSREAAPGSAFELRESDESVHTLLAKLPSEQAEVIALRLFGELRFEEIAEVVGAPITTVKSRMTYGLQKIGTVLSRKQGGKP